MRINVYSQELTPEVIMIEKQSNTGLVYSAVQMILHSSEKLHHPPQDDDRSAVTFWLPKSETRREELAQTFEEMAARVRAARSETGPTASTPRPRRHGATACTKPLTASPPPRAPLRPHSYSSRTASWRNSGASPR